MKKDPETTILSDVHSHGTFIPDPSLNLVDNDPTCDIQMDDGGNSGSTDVDMEVASEHELGDNTNREPKNATTDTYVSDDYATEAAVQNIGTSTASFDLGDLIGNSRRMVTDYQKYQYLKHHFIPDSSYTGLLKQVVTKADETTDVSNKEMLSVCLRFVSCNREIKEVFFDFVHLRQTSGEKIANAILESLRDHNIDITKCRGQGYDGAAAMSSMRVGVQARIKERAPLALYVHCNSHVLNLCIAAACKLPPVRNMIDSLNEIYFFFNNSPKRQTFFELVVEKEDNPSKVKKLKGLCKTRWVESHVCYETFFELFPVICKTFEGMLNPEEVDLVDLPNGPWIWDRETRIKAQGLLSTVKTSSFIVAFITVKSCLETIKPLSIKLQKRDQDIYTAYNSIDKVKESIENLRLNIEEEFSERFRKNRRAYWNRNFKA
ncbi:unnamed protein product [Mytilus coruscus]|uniref:DUF4371 domain-containing protein n=1 Tax=Mytilus coruscus TaxID=42192 RepID=A0A6J8DHC7_MYTCO|nr:unnamed protein product [Mytilus coruscus]